MSEFGLACDCTIAASAAVVLLTARRPVWPTARFADVTTCVIHGVSPSYLEPFFVMLKKINVPLGPDVATSVVPSLFKSPTSKCEPTPERL